MTGHEGERSWWLYLIECRGGRIYTGIALDVEARYAKHAAGKGAAFTRAFPPVRILAREEHPSKGAALRAENGMKRRTAEEKRAWAKARGLGRGQVE